jgi:preprotein translocase subunit YajC
MSGGILILIVIGFALFFLFVIRPTRRRQNEQLTMQESLEVGDEIVTAGGMYGTVAGVDEDEVAIEVAEGVVVRIARRAVAGVMPPDEDEEAGGEPPEEDEEAPLEAAEREPENASRS